MKSIAGVVVFIVVWILLGNVASHYIFPNVAADYPGQFSWILCVGAVIYMLCDIAEKIVTGKWNE